MVGAVWLYFEGGVKGRLQNHRIMTVLFSLYLFSNGSPEPDRTDHNTSNAPPLLSFGYICRSDHVLVQSTNSSTVLEAAWLNGYGRVKLRFYFSGKGPHEADGTDCYAPPLLGSNYDGRSGVMVEVA
ncbi:hypothetical protein CIPAW_08G109900 [Carya illinoinensis]|uniref:Uncharacterized protein n=1 Tax=Carya illinoinensis TaxID=32201 RepID=A0A8T1PY94_CARIL|nr:hypothetical protein CIPAW_08G109900 [Carya illinoinensis]